MDNAKLDFLRELGSIGAGHATTALSQMLQGRMLQLVVPDARMIPFEEAAGFPGGLEQVVTGIFIEVSGDIRGHMAFILPVDSAAKLVSWMLPADEENSEEMASSLLQEIGNIMITSYLNALAALADMVFAPSVPGIATDMAGAVWQSVLADAQVANEVTLIKTDFHADGNSIEGHIIFLPDVDHFAKLTCAFGLEEV